MTAKGLVPRHGIVVKNGSSQNRTTYCCGAQMIDTKEKAGPLAVSVWFAKI
jgi:hypothetical protein